jgi:hypothetical protein
MKYKPEEYIGCGFYSNDDSEIENYKEKLVKCRKSHECMGGCNTTIQSGETALYETGFMDGGPVSCYTCIPCLDGWLDTINGVYDKEAQHGSATP